MHLLYQVLGLLDSNPNYSPLPNIYADDYDPRIILMFDG